MSVVKYKSYFLKQMFDCKNRLCSPKCRLNSHKHNKKVYNFLKNNLNKNISISESIHRTVNNIKTNPKCEFCNKNAKYFNFINGYKKTCGNEKCLKKSYGKNPHIPTFKERRNISLRMKLNNPMFNLKIKNKRKKTIKELYGTEPLVKEKSILKSLNTRYDKYKTFSPKNVCFKPKKFIFPSGRECFIQGYEDKAINELLKKYKETDIEICGRKYKFFYFYKNKKRIYYPDIFLKSKKIFIDAKSKYTFNLNKYKNLLKKCAVEKEGYKFKFMIYK